jgi:hypothetical protein
MHTHARELTNNELEGVSGGVEKLEVSSGYTLVRLDSGGLFLCGPGQCVPMPSPTYPFLPPK